MYETNQLNRGWQIGSYQSVDIMVSEFSTFLCLQGQIRGKVWYKSQQFRVRVLQEIIFDSYALSKLQMFWP